jgi:hypothetical protein
MSVMAALVAAIHEHPCKTVLMDGRNKPGHDGVGVAFGVLVLAFDTR